MDPSTPVYFFSGDQDPVGGMGKGVKKVVEMFRQAGAPGRDAPPLPRRPP